MKEPSQEFRIPRKKRVLLNASATILFCLGTIPSIPTSIFMKSVLPLLGGLYLAFLAYSLFVWASQTMRITAEGVLLTNRKREYLLQWSDVGEYAQGKGIDRYKVTYTLASDLPPSKINLGLFFVSHHNRYYLPDTFGMHASELAILLEQIRKEKAQQIASPEDIPDSQS